MRAPRAQSVSGGSAPFETPVAALTKKRRSRRLMTSRLLSELCNPRAGPPGRHAKSATNAAVDVGPLFGPQKGKMAARARL